MRNDDQYKTLDNTQIMNNKQRLAPLLAAFMMLGCIMALAQTSPPTQDLVLWLNADTGVSVSAGTNVVTTWTDQSGAANEHNCATTVGAPLLTQAGFPNGSHSVVGFDGASGLTADNPSDFYLNNLSIYVVGCVSNQAPSQEFIACWSGVAFGINDGLGGIVKFVTYPPADTMSPTNLLSSGVQYLITGTFENLGEKAVYLNGNRVAYETNNTGVSYGGGTLDIGMLFNTGAQFLNGDIAEVLVYSSASDAQRAAVEQYLQAKYFLNPGPVSITSQPQSLQVTVPAPATFQVGVDGTPPFTYQWQKNGSPIAGATNNTYTILSTAVNDSGNYTVALTNSLGFTNSQTAVLTVNANTNAPLLVSALRNYTDPTSVTVVFSEAVTAASATNVSNYAINDGVVISSVSVGTGLNSVVLTTSPVTNQPSATLTVNGVQSVLSSAPIAANSTIAIPVPASNIAPPPSQDRILWLAADTGTTTNPPGLTVIEWDDQSGAANEHNATYCLGSPQLTQGATPNGIHPMIGFNGGDAFNMDNSADINTLQDFSVYTVVSIDNTKPSEIFLSTWDAWNLGISDGTPGEVKFDTDAPYQDMLGGALGNYVPTIVTAALSLSAGTKTLYVNKSQVAAITNGYTCTFPGPGGPIIGSLFSFGSQPLTGNIAEILIYSSVSDTQRAAVESYLTQKYLIPTANPPLFLNISASGGMISISWDGSATLQSATQVNGVWSDVTGATSPYSVSPSIGASQFYRLKQ